MPIDGIITAMRQRHICVSTFLSGDFSRRLLDGIADGVARHMDWSLEFVRTNDLPRRAGDGFDGFICDITSERSASVLKRLGRPVVNTLHLNDRVDFPSVRPDYAAVAAMAADHFLERHHENFAFCGFHRVGFSDSLCDAFSACVSAHGFRTAVYCPRGRQSQANLVTGDYEAMNVDAEPELREWLMRLKRPVAVFCCNDQRAHSVISACRECGLGVPDDVAVLGSDNDSVLGIISTPQLSTIDPNAVAIGHAAVEMLNEQFQSPDGVSGATVRSVGPAMLITRGSSERFLIGPAWLTHALAYIRRNAARGISAADVFSYLGYSHTLVQRTFRKHLGTTVQQQIAKTRLNGARELLARKTSTPISKIARDCGFASAIYFCRCYKQAFGESPSQTRARPSSRARAAR